jgi:Protein of unknown function (DUF3300)
LAGRSGVGVQSAVLFTFAIRIALELAAATIGSKFCSKRGQPKAVHGTRRLTDNVAVVQFSNVQRILSKSSEFRGGSCHRKGPHVSRSPFATALTAAVALLAAGCLSSESQAQGQPLASSPESAAILANPDAVGVAVDAPKPLSASELEALVSGIAIDPADGSLSTADLEILVARIALYPDELIAVITAASLYPLQIVEAQRFLDESKTNTALKPKPTWDGSVVSLLNYPEIVRMMSEDLDWTQRLAEAIVNQQQGVLAAIQQLREKAVANGVVKTDDKMKVVEENDKIVIQPASAEVIYVPQYQPEMLYDEDYIYRPIAYYPDPYPYYYSPIAPFFAGVVTGAIWVGFVDWDDGFRGGHWGRDWGNDIYIDCNNCFNNRRYKGRLAINDVDWKSVDRRKIRFDRNQLSKIDRSTFKNNIVSDDRNRLINKPKNIWGDQASTRPGEKTRSARNVRKATLDGLKKQPGRKLSAKQVGSEFDAEYNLTKPVKRFDGKTSRGQAIDRRIGDFEPRVKKDKRRKNTIAIEDVKRGKSAKKLSNRRAKSINAGNYKKSNGGSYKKIKKQRMPQGGGQRSKSRRCNLPACQS